MHRFKITIKKKENIFNRLNRKIFIGIKFVVKVNIKENMYNKIIFEIIDYIPDEDKFEIEYLGVSNRISATFKNDADEVIIGLQKGTYEEIK